MFDLDLSSCVPKCDLGQLDSRLIDKLYSLEFILGFSPKYTSAFRSKEFELSKGRKGDSSHCKGLAVDVSTPDSHTRFLVVVSALSAGFDRIGIGKSFVHLDIDESKAHPIIFHYYE